MTRCLQKAACRSNASFPMLRLRTLNLAFSIWQYFLMIYEVRYVFCLKFLRSLPLNLYPSSWCLAGDKHVAPPDLLWFANACTGRAKKECVHRELKRHRHLHGIYLGSPDLQGRLKVWKCRFFSQIKGWERVIHVFAFVFFWSDFNFDPRFWGVSGATCWARSQWPQRGARASVCVSSQHLPPQPVDELAVWKWTKQVENKQKKCQKMSKNTVQHI